MRLKTQKEHLLKPLQQTVGVVERRQTLPILGHVLLVIEDDSVRVTATDLEVELMAQFQLPGAEPGRVTLPARKLLDIVRQLPDGCDLELFVDRERVVLRTAAGRFTLAPLEAEDFPVLDEIQFDTEFTIQQSTFRDLLERTHFAMAQQDVRYYLNGLYIETDEGRMNAVATDGHRLAICELERVTTEDAQSEVIIPRKGVQELLRLLEDTDSSVHVKLASSHVSVSGDDFRFTSRLIDGRFPNYQRVIPTISGPPLIADRLPLRDALSRAAILSNEKYRGVRLKVSENALDLLAHNPENEAAEEHLEVEYDGPSFEIGFNVNYLLEALGAIRGERVELYLFDSNTSCLLQDAKDDSCRYVVMPMRL
jgi:DNA polymerase-3 subunit beta